MLAINLPLSFRPGAMAASASGKLAPQKSVGGKRAQKARSRSSWKLNQMFEEIEGLTGQYGRDAPAPYAVQAIATAARNWHHANARRGRETVRLSKDPIPLPIPSPARKTATTKESVYTDAPKSSPSKRVQMTSAAIAQKPESAMAM